MPDEYEYTLIKSILYNIKQYVAGITIYCGYSKYCQYNLKQ